MGNAIIWAAIGGAVAITALRALIVTAMQVARMERERKAHEYRERIRAEKQRERAYKERFWRNQAEIDRDFR